MKFLSALGTKLEEFLSRIIDNNKNRDPEHTLFNITCLMGIFFFLFFIVINIVFEIDLKLTLVKLTGVAIFSFLFYLSRNKGMYKPASFLFFIVLLVAFLYLGIENGGVLGGIAPLFAGILALMLFITEGLRKHVLLSLWFVSISALFVIEFYHPELIKPYATKNQAYFDMYISYLTGTFLVAAVVVMVKKLFYIQTQNINDLIGNIQINQKLLREHVNGKMGLLTDAERRVFQLLLEGKSREDISQKLGLKTEKASQLIDSTINRLSVDSFIDRLKILSRSERKVLENLVEEKSNQEISDVLYISLGTVKSHINRIYKKLGVKDRLELINHKHQIAQFFEGGMEDFIQDEEGSLQLKTD